jgi:acetyltransferase
VRAAGRRQLTLAEAMRVIAASGIPVAPWVEAADAAEASAAAEGLGFPVALKVNSAGIVHKSDSGGVRLHLSSAASVGAAAGDMLRSSRREDPGASLIVQRMVRPAHEVILGASTDPKYGPLLMFGLGGMFVEVLEDVTFRVHPISDVDASEMVRSIRAFPILEGARGGLKAHLPAVEEALQRLSFLLSVFPEIHDVDINPFMAGGSAEDAMAVDARIGLAPPPTTP